MLLCPFLTLSSKAWVCAKASHSMHLAPRHWWEPTHWVDGLVWLGLGGDEK